ncbi:TPA: transcription antitermination factor NusB [Candidatus Uhrbacteria bacterium]|nr:MAG: transcription antitermination factor NusB [Candidatus Uhrbacteria bacterium RIFOXYB2_FULL_41_10]HAL50189.1 transcription antitermination factor NusB [Candidatus Uhrbacteria bacterium]HAN06326.1 transcription antitermination factor NusB [Candidatus Uhrbacteria bacterium]HAP65426.1 transcription antitermination factor NusB [Candidatus Uhrbacteria bacterium]HBA51956.1 transcription antitermination factor NusB [Candidatus Uhrbacteria bacterium]
MSNRHLSRTMVMQCLFEWDFQGRDSSRIDEVVAYIKEEFAPNFDDDGYVLRQTHAVIDSVDKIDETLVTFAPEWPIDEMTNTDRNILRLGVYELKFDEKIPAKVAINEAIELGKAFGGEASGKFVNGVLGAVFRDMIAKGAEKQIDKEEEKEKSNEE